MKAECLLSKQGLQASSEVRISRSQWAGGSVEKFNHFAV